MESNVLKRTSIAILLCAACTIGLLSLCPSEGYGETTAPFPSFWDERPNEELIEAIVAEMTDEELLGQVFMLGYIGKHPSEQVLGWIRSRNLGGVKIFTRNVDTLPGLTRSIAAMQETARAGRFQIPLFMSTDQEGEEPGHQYELRPDHGCLLQSFGQRHRSTGILLRSCNHGHAGTGLLPGHEQEWNHLYGQTLPRARSCG